MRPPRTKYSVTLQLSQIFCKLLRIKHTDSVSVNDLFVEMFWTLPPPISRITFGRLLLIYSTKWLLYSCVLLTLAAVSFEVSTSTPPLPHHPFPLFFRFPNHPSHLITPTFATLSNRSTPLSPAPLPIPRHPSYSNIFSQASTIGGTITILKSTTTVSPQILLLDIPGFKL